MSENKLTESSVVKQYLTTAATKRFFATMQNNLHWAIHGQTAPDSTHAEARRTRRLTL